eukprot:m.54951 g.54951  ORF g.54951 m.54951 type:complete len:189 (-) comp16836_c0_seq1:1703-2269(-)
MRGGTTALVVLVVVGMTGSGLADDGIVRQLSDLGGQPYNVSYNNRSMLLSTPTDKDRPVLLLSGSVHYVRSTPEMWPSIFAKLKASGLNAVESYVFWNFHVHSLEAHNNKTVDYTGRGNVTYFLELAEAHDLFVIWRIGPYVVCCAVLSATRVARPPTSPHVSSQCLGTFVPSGRAGGCRHGSGRSLG